MSAILKTTLNAKPITRIDQIDQKNESLNTDYISSLALLWLKKRLRFIYDTLNRVELHHGLLYLRLQKADPAGAARGEAGGVGELQV